MRSVDIYGRGAAWGLNSSIHSQAGDRQSLDIFLLVNVL